jgi:hypothetical protein
LMSFYDERVEIDHRIVVAEEGYRRVYSKMCISICK